MIKYSNGSTFQKNNKQNKHHISQQELSISSANRGMSFESDINQSNEYYKLNKICLVTKRPTPINVVKVDYSNGAIITQAYFEHQSTTDYNGVYNGKYLDFEAKSTKNKTSFPLTNISSHQIEHLENVILHGGIAFFLIQFVNLDKVFMIDASVVINFYKNGERKSIPINYFIENECEVKTGINPRIDYINKLNKNYCL